MSLVIWEYLLTPEERKQLRIARQRAVLEIPMLQFSLDDCLSKVQRAFFPNLAEDVSVGFVEQPNLACIMPQPLSAMIYLHLLLNCVHTPRQVVEFIFKHELLHLVIPPREIDGRMTSHPPEFWEAEHAICPEGKLVWCWLMLLFGSVLHRDEKQESTRVKRGWKNKLDALFTRDLPNINFDWKTSSP